MVGCGVRVGTGYPPHQAHAAALIVKGADYTHCPASNTQHQKPNPPFHQVQSEGNAQGNVSCPVWRMHPDKEGSRISLRPCEEVKEGLRGAEEADDAHAGSKQSFLPVYVGTGPAFPMPQVAFPS